MKKNTAMGTLYLLPSRLGKGGEKVIPEYVLPILEEIEYFIVEHPKTARQFLRSIGFKGDFNRLAMEIYDKRSEAEIIYTMLEPVEQGKNAVLISEAGCPGVADPGSSLVSLAHIKNIRVIPLVGPSSFLLALMASGLNGQRFAFNGYLPVQAKQRISAIRQLEKKALNGETQIFMETPYRNNALLNDLLKNCNPEIRLCVAVDITLDSERIQTKSIEKWKSHIPDINKKPCVFLLGVS